MKTSTYVGGLAALTLVLGSVVATAQTGGTPPSDMQNMDHAAMAHDTTMANMPAMHAMAATVTAVDTKTGMVEATSDGMSLKLHFPASSVASLKAGDKISVHLGFSKQ